MLITCLHIPVSFNDAATISTSGKNVRDAMLDHELLHSLHSLQALALLSRTYMNPAVSDETIFL
jgi:hypothetical protein